jgi:hypothetical protein
MNPEARHAGLIDWQLFCTWTFKSDALPSQVKIKQLFAFLREVAELSGTSFKRMLWMVRAEDGEITGRFHYHGLIGGLPPSFCSIANCFRLALIWHPEPEIAAPNYHGKKLRMGWAEIRKFNVDLDGVGYVLKGLPPGARAQGANLDRGLKGPSGADLYEYSKFSSDTSTVTLSESCIRLLERRMEGSRKRKTP